VLEVIVYVSISYYSATACAEIYLPFWRIREGGKIIFTIGKCRDITASELLGANEYLAQRTGSTEMQV